jgi:sigma-B regulation protein RsbU (phosphoserine phosphatase)
MRKGLDFWRQLGGIEKAFLIAVALWALLVATGIAPTWQSLLALASVLLGLVSLFRLARLAMRSAIWRLRNRLIAAYLFIAVVPIVLILTLVGFAGYAVIGGMAAYLVNTELTHREEALMRQAEALAHVPAADPERALGRAAMMVRSAFPDFQLLVTSPGRTLRYPPDAVLTQPPAKWHRAHGLILRKEGKEDRLYAWAHARDQEEVTVLAPITSDLLSKLAQGLGDVNFVPLLMGSAGQSRIPAPRNAFDFKIRGYYPLSVDRWESPDEHREPVLVVDTRISAVLGTVFQKLDWAEFVVGLFGGIAVLFLVVELVSLFAGVQLSRSITGAVHELYEGTQHVKEGNFTYRIPVKGKDQLAELADSFNGMTENLGRLIVVAKEKERLESELAIAREVQNQLFPKNVPFTRSLELTGVCNPARMVSGDYYDFMSLSENALAFAIGDVAGKGISAALLMATIQSTMRTQLSSVNGNGPSHLSTAKLVANLNRQLYATTAPEKYATFYFALYDDSSHTLTYTNAGHLAPILLRGSTISTLDSTGTVVGAFPIARYAEKTIELQQGDTLVAYTDGIIEPENAYGEMFGEERLQELLVKHARADSQEIIARIMEAVNQWTGSSELQDDMTMVVARRLSA